MPARKRTVIGVVAALLAAVLAGQAYERELSGRDLRAAYFLGKDRGFRLERFLKGYAQTFPVPERGIHVERIMVATPFKQMVDRARLAPDGYSPLSAREEYQENPPGVAVEVTFKLTPTFPAHTPYTIPAYGPITFQSPEFWRLFQIRLVQRGEVEPAAVRGRPLYSCDNINCNLIGAVVTLHYDPARVASRKAQVVVLGPDGQRVEAEFDLGRLR